MENIESEFFRYWALTTEESRKEDETFIELQIRYAEYLHDLEKDEFRAIFGDTTDDEE